MHSAIVFLYIFYTRRRGNGEPGIDLCPGMAKQDQARKKPFPEKGSGRNKMC
jgi:hypothetical protein